VEGAAFVLTFTRFPNISLSLWLPYFLLEVTDILGNAKASNVRTISFSQVRKKDFGLSFIW